MCVDSREKTSSLHREDVWKRVADFVSRRKWAVSWVQRQIRHVIRASRSWICCSTPKWDYFAMFFVDSCINMLSNLLQTSQFGFLMIWTFGRLGVYKRLVEAVRHQASPFNNLSRSLDTKIAMYEAWSGEKAATWGTRGIAEYLLIFIV